MFCVRARGRVGVSFETTAITGPGAHLDDAHEDPEGVFLGGMSEEQRRDEVVHALAVCAAPQERSAPTESSGLRKRGGRTANLWIAPRVRDKDVAKLGDAGPVASEKDVRREGAVACASTRDEQDGDAA